jgi:hypothetical protein
MPRFGILRHDSPRGLHWDFMLEAQGVLKTWALAQPPETVVEQTAEALADHRLHYLDYEGPVLGDRGTVSRWDQGSYLAEQQADDCWRVVLHGERIDGEVSFARLADTPDRWRFTFSRRSSPGTCCGPSG